MEDAISTNKRFHSQTKEKRLIAQDAEFATLAHSILTSPDFDKIRRLPHHDASVADHSVAVAYYAYKIARILGLRSRLSELTRGALLHDFFHYDWRTGKPRTGGLHCFDHPKEALQNAEESFGPLSALERDCILRHMWPLTPIPPRFLESFIVCFADKAVALGESWNALRTGKGLGVL